MNRDSLLVRRRPIVCVVGARPNFMKMAPILRALANTPNAWPTVLVHTGQHYDANMNDRVFSDLRLPSPDLNLEVGSGTHAVQTAEVMRRFEPVLDEYTPSTVLVVGDVNSTLACSLVAVKKDIPVVHVEAGLRSFDRRMPEEINRVLTDQIADRLYTTEKSAHANLAREGVEASRICFVGNVMIDTLLSSRAIAREPRQTLAAAGIDQRALNNAVGFALVTLHRPSNVDERETLQGLLVVLNEVARRLPVIFPMHPRTCEKIRTFGLQELVGSGRIIVLPPQGYLETLGLLMKATVVLTDSGGIQEESTALGVPCLTVRENTERPITVEEGTNTLVGSDGGLILKCVDEAIAGGGKRGRIPELWDGRASERLAADLTVWLAQREPQLVA